MKLYSQPVKTAAAQSINRKEVHIMAMFQPTYGQIIDKINEENGEETLTSRYSVVIAASKRARQIVDGAKVLVKSTDEKPLTLAVDELYDGDVRVYKKKKTENEE